MNLNCPAGLEWLLPLDHFWVQRNVDSIGGLLRPWDTRKTYRVCDDNGQTIFTGVEESGNVSVCCFGHSRPWEFKFFDNNRKEVLSCSRPFNWWLQEMAVYAGGQPIGFVYQNFSCFSPSFSILNHRSRYVLGLEGPPCWGADILNVNFHITSTDGTTRIGVLTKQWTGFSREFFGNGNSFCTRFPEELDVKMKAVLIGASILVDFMHWNRR